MKSAVKAEEWGRASSDQPIKLFTLSDARIRVRLTEYGAGIVSIDAPDRHGQTADVVLGHNNLAAYLADPKSYFGAIVGRYGNRIANGTFRLAGSNFHIPLNDNHNALHGGPGGFSTKVWHGRSVGTNPVEFTLVSPDGDMGFRGALTVHVFYTLGCNKLLIRYEASTSKPTVLNLTNHSFFNLSGEASGGILAQELRINADRITPVAAGLIPTGAFDRVRGTPFDFTHLTPIGRRIHSQDSQIKLAGGYDQNFVLNGQPGKLGEAAFAFDPASGRTLTVFTSEPGLQFYSGNLLHGSVTGFSGKTYQNMLGSAWRRSTFLTHPITPTFRTLHFGPATRTIPRPFSSSEPPLRLTSIGPRRATH